MTDDTRTLHRDDAPVTASKDAKPDRTLLGEAVTIARSAQELYDFWRDQANLARFMENVVAIEPVSGNRFRWTVKAPLGREVSWEAEITHEVSGREMNWQSVAGGDVANSGKITFTEAGERGTVVRAVIAYEPPAGVIGQTVAKLFQREPKIQARRDLHRFKQLMETGEISVSARNRRQLEERNEETLTEQAA